MTFDVSTEQLTDGTFVVSVAGEVDVYNLPDIEAQLQDVFGRGGRRVIVDLCRTTFIDSMGMGVLVGAMKYLRTVDGKLALVCSDHDVGRFFKIAGLDRVFAMCDSRAEALASLDAPSA